jgi:hypothetical protein
MLLPTSFSGEFGDVFRKPTLIRGRQSQELTPFAAHPWRPGNSSPCSVWHWVVVLMEETRRQTKVIGMPCSQIIRHHIERRGKSRCRGRFLQSRPAISFIAIPRAAADNGRTAPARRPLDGCCRRPGRSRQDCLVYGRSSAMIGMSVLRLAYQACSRHEVRDEQLRHRNLEQQFGWPHDESGRNSRR